MRPFATISRGFVVLGVLLSTGMARPIIAQEESLYDRLGGLPAIEAVVDQLLVNVVGDDRINMFFANADAASVRNLLVEQICEGTGGPCAYRGRGMRDVHAGMGITDADFMALVEDLVMALDSLGVPELEKNELLAILAPMQGDVVQVPAMAPAAPPVVAPPPPAPPVVAPPPGPPVVAPPPPSAPPPGPARASVDIRDFSFRPPTLTVAVGSTITWTNSDGAPHTATGPGFDTGTLTRGQSGSATFSTPGQFNYRCNIHPNIQGVIVVQ